MSRILDNKDFSLYLCAFFASGIIGDLIVALWIGPTFMGPRSGGVMLGCIFGGIGIGMIVGTVSLWTYLRIREWKLSRHIPMR